MVAAPEPSVQRPLRVAIYGRNSLGDRNETISVDAQVDVARQYADAKGWKVHYLVIEDDTKADYYRRPKWLLLLARARAHLFDVLLTWKLDRWARSIWDALRTERFLHGQGIAIVSCVENIDTTTPQGQFAFRSLANVAELERNMIGQRVSMARRAWAKRGLWHTRKGPLGYAIDKDFRPKKNLEELRIVRRIWDLYFETQSAPAVAKRLNDEGPPPRRGKTWTHKRIYSALDNPLIWGRVERLGESVERKTLRAFTAKERERMRELRARKIVRKPAMPPSRKQDAINHVWGQYQEMMQEEALDEAREEVEAQAEGIDPAFVRNLLEETASAPPKIRAERARWRKRIAAAITSPHI